MDKSILKTQGDVGGIQFNGILKSEVSDKDILILANGKTLIGKDVEILASSQFSLNGNYPNSFNPQTTIFYSVNDDSDIKISIYNLLGERIDELVNDYHI